MGKRTPPPKPLIKQAAEFVRWHLNDKHAFAPFTGFDYPCWCAYVHALEAYSRADYNGRPKVIAALSNLVSAAQQTNDVLACFKKVIPHLMDWADEDKLWSQIGPNIGGGDVRWPCLSGERKERAS